jgi:hypothetical protein
MRFRLVQVLSKINSPTYNIAILCYKQIDCSDELYAATYIVKRTAL